MPEENGLKINRTKTEFQESGLEEEGNESDRNVRLGGQCVNKVERFECLGPVE